MDIHADLPFAQTVKLAKFPSVKKQASSKRHSISTSLRASAFDKPLKKQCKNTENY